jgi:rRNA-processing protein FCF1
MRLQRHKKQDKYLRFYLTRYGYRSPLRIIIDSAFLRRVVEGGQGEPLDVLFSRVFGKLQVRLLVTPCVMRAISRKIKEADKEFRHHEPQSRALERSVGPEELAPRPRTPDWWRRTSWLARKLVLLPCGHEKRGPSDSDAEQFEADCIEACVDRGPEAAQQAGLSRWRGRYAVATVDDALRTRLGSKPGTMLLRLAFISGGIHVQIEPPSAACLQAASEYDRRYSSATAAELEAAREAQYALRQEHQRHEATPDRRDTSARGNQPRSSAPSIIQSASAETAGGSTDGNAPLLRPKRSRQSIRSGHVPWMDVKTNVAGVFKRKRGRGANPLSQRKPQKRR